MLQARCPYCFSNDLDRFALQQLIEGVIWLTFQFEAPILNSVTTHVYSFFSHVLWPAYVPVAVWFLEPPGWRRKALLALMVAGAVVGAYLLYYLVAYPITSRPTGQHIEYISPHFFIATVLTLCPRLPACCFRHIQACGHSAYLHSSPFRPPMRSTQRGSFRCGAFSRRC